MTIGLGHYLSVGAMLFTLGIFGIFLNRMDLWIRLQEDSPVPTFLLLC